MLKKRWVWLVVLVAVGFILRYLAYGFIKLPWVVYDEFTYLDTARQIVRGQFLSAFTRDQLYPAGWPVFLAAFIGYFQNPLIQYKAALVVTMLISSVVPVLAYLMSGSLVVAFAATVFPSLFVYSSNIFSETAYILFLVFGFLVLRQMLKDDLKSKLYIFWSGTLFGFILFYIRITRSFGVIHIPALIATLGAFVFLFKQHIQKTYLKKLIRFVMVTLVAYVVLSLMAEVFSILPGGLYERTSYFTALRLIVVRPLTALNMVQNQVIIILVSMFWVLPIFFFNRLVHDFREKKWHEVFARLFLMVVLASSLALTLAHMGKTVMKNDQYLVFSRYMDPILVVWFIYAFADMLRALATIKTFHFSRWWFFFLGYLLVYLKFYFYVGSYKYGNTMPVYFLSLLDSHPLFYPLFAGAVVAMLAALALRKKRVFITLFALLFTVQSFVAVLHSTGVPFYVEKNHAAVMSEWKQALTLAGEDAPICLYPQALWSETYYMYHFLHPYQYLKKCDPVRQDAPRWVIISAKNGTALPKSCVYNYSFASSGGDSLFYCPLGIK